jgi:hypothetical protein
MAATASAAIRTARRCSGRGISSTRIFTVTVRASAFPLSALPPRPSALARSRAGRRAWCGGRAPRKLGPWRCSGEKWAAPRSFGTLNCDEGDQKGIDSCLGRLRAERWSVGFFRWGFGGRLGGCVRVGCCSSNSWEQLSESRAPCFISKTTSLFYLSGPIMQLNLAA